MNGRNRSLAYHNKPVDDAFDLVSLALGFAHLSANLMLERGGSVRQVRS